MYFHYEVSRPYWAESNKYDHLDQRVTWVFIRKQAASHYAMEGCTQE